MGEEPTLYVTSSDGEIVRRSRESPPEFGVLFQRYSSTVHRYVARRAGVQVADEVMAETFLVAFEQRARFDDTWDSARPWLFGIATNLLNAHRRQEARHLRLLARAAETDVIDGGIHRAGERTDAAAAVGALADQLRALPHSDRDVLLLQAWGDLTQEQIAAVLNIPVGTVWSRLNRARKSLRSGAASEGDKETHHGRIDAAARA